MKNIYLLIPVLFICFHVFAGDAYIENKGQITDQHHKLNEDVLYLYNAKGINLQLRKNGFSYDVWQSDEQNNTIQFHRIDINFANYNTRMLVQHYRPSADYLNYYSANAVTKIRSYEQVVYKNVWPNIDISFELQGETPKYNIIAYAGAKLTDIQLQVNGANDIQPNGNGLSIATDISVIEEEIPYSYYLQGDEKHDVHAAFTGNNGLYGITVKETIPVNATLLIDPIPAVYWCTMYGAGGKDYGYNTVTAPNGDVYLSGTTSSTTAIATSGSFRGTYTAGTDAFIAKFDENGKRLWGTYYGGDSTEYADDMAINSTGTVICLSGTTLSDTGIATIGAHQTIKDAGEDIYLLVMDSSGQRIWSTYYGGDGEDETASAAMDAIGNIYLAGTTYSSNGIATNGAYKDSAPTDINSSSQGFLVKFNNSGTRLWGTYYGGSDGENMDIAGIFKDTVIYVSGYTASDTGIATTGTYQPDAGGSSDLFIALFDSAGHYRAGTYFGGPMDEYSNRKSKIDDSGYVYLHGYTQSDTMIATGNVQQDTLGGGGYDAVLAKFKPGLDIVWSTYYGGDGPDEMNSIAVDSEYNIYVTGITESTNQIATPNTWLFSNPNGGQHMFLSKFSREGKLIWGTYLLGATTLGMTVDNNNDVYLAAWSTVAQVGTAGAHQQFHGGGGQDAFLMKLIGCHPGFASASSNSPTLRATPLTLMASPANMLSYKWSHAGGFTSNLQNPTIYNTQYSDSGLYTVVITDSNACEATATVFVHVVGENITDVNGNHLFSIYPNPTQDILYVDNHLPSASKAYISNTAGQIIYSSQLTTGRNKVNAMNFATGVYYITIEFNNQKETRKIIVQR